MIFFSFQIQNILIRLPDYLTRMLAYRAKYSVLHSIRNVAYKPPGMLALTVCVVDLTTILAAVHGIN